MAGGQLSRVPSARLLGGGAHSLRWQKCVVHFLQEKASAAAADAAAAVVAAAAAAQIDISERVVAEEGGRAVLIWRCSMASGPAGGLWRHLQ